MCINTHQTVISASSLLIPRSAFETELALNRNNCRLESVKGKRQGHVDLSCSDVDVTWMAAKGMSSRHCETEEPLSMSVCGVCVCV